MGERGTLRLTADQGIAILKRNGFSLAGQSANQVIVASHRGRELPFGTMRSIIEGSGIPAIEWKR